MSAVVAALEGGRIYMCADDQGGSEDGSRGTFLTPKAFFLSGLREERFLVGYAGNYRLGQILRYSINLPECPVGMDAEEYMCQGFSEALHEALEECKFLGVDDQGRHTGGYTLVGFDGRLFVIQHDFDVIEPASGVEALGSGAREARAATQAAINCGTPAKDAVRIGIEIAEQYNMTVGRPVEVLTL